MTGLYKGSISNIVDKKMLPSVKLFAETPAYAQILAYLFANEKADRRDIHRFFVIKDNHPRYDYYLSKLREMKVIRMDSKKDYYLNYTLFSEILLTYYCYFTFFRKIVPPIDRMIKLSNNKDFKDFKNYLKKESVRKKFKQKLFPESYKLHTSQNIAKQTNIPKSDVDWISNFTGIKYSKYLPLKTLIFSIVGIDAKIIKKMNKVLRILLLKE